MEYPRIDFSVLLFLVILVIGLLVPVAQRFYSWLMAYLETVRRLDALQLPKIAGHNLIGYTFHFGNWQRTPKKMNIGTHVLHIMNGMCVMYPNDGIIQMDLGYFLPSVVVYKHDTVEKILMHPKEVHKAREYYFLDKIFGNGLITCSADKWKKHRKMIQPAFHPKILGSYQTAMSSKSKRLVEKLKRFRNMEIDSLETWISNCTLDIICGTSLGFEIEDCDNEPHPLVESTDNVTCCALERIAVPLFWFDVSFNFSVLGKAFNHQVKTLVNYCKEMSMNKRRNSIEAKISDDLIDDSRLLPFVRRLQKFNGKGEISESDIIEHARTIAITGYDAPATALLWAMYFLGLHQDVQKKAFEEINGIFDGDRERPITCDDLDKMIFLECVIKESLRVVPIGPLVGRELEEDLEIGGHLVPKGTSVFVMIWSLHRDPELFPNPEIFDPERFRNNKFPKYAFIPFSGGPRGCIGFNFAMQEMKTIVGDLLRNYKWNSLDPFDVVYPSWTNVIVHPACPVRIHLEDRCSEIN